MYLAGQGARRQPSSPVQKLDDSGYIMVVLLIGMAVSAVWMGALLPAWRQQAIRQKEAELIFRGEQYARAIALYWRKNNQTLPPSLDVLVSQRYLRKKYVDPITNTDFLTVGGLGPGFGGSGRVGGPSPQPSGPPGGGQMGPSQGLPGQGQPGTRAGISGVRSTSTATSIVVYRGQTSYSQFPFDYITALQRMGSGMPQLGGADQGAGRGGVRRGGPGGLGPGRFDERIDGGRGRSASPSGPGRAVFEGRRGSSGPGRGP